MSNWKIAPTQLITSNLFTMVKDAMGSTWRGYDAVVPLDAEHPYWMLSFIPGGEKSGPPLTNPEGDVALPFQIDGVGRRRDQAQLVLDKAVEAALGRNADGSFINTLVLPPGWAQCDRMSSEGSGGVEPEGAPPNTIYTAVQRITVVVTPT